MKSRILLMIVVIGLPLTASTISTSAAVSCATPEQYIQQQNVDGSHLACAIGSNLMADAQSVTFTRSISTSAQVYSFGYSYASARAFAQYDESMFIAGSGDGIFTAHYEVRLHDVNDFGGPLEALVSIQQGGTSRTFQQAGDHVWQVYISNPFTYGTPFDILIQASVAAFSPGMQIEMAGVSLLGAEYDGKRMVSALGGVQTPEPNTALLVLLGLLVLVAIAWRPS